MDRVMLMLPVRCRIRDLQNVPDWMVFRWRMLKSTRDRRIKRDSRESDEHLSEDLPGILLSPLFVRKESWRCMPWALAIPGKCMGIMPTNLNGPLGQPT